MFQSISGNFEGQRRIEDATGKETDDVQFSDDLKEERDCALVDLRGQRQIGKCEEDVFSQRPGPEKIGHLMTSWHRRLSTRALRLGERVGKHGDENCYVRLAVMYSCRVGYVARYSIYNRPYPVIV